MTTFRNLICCAALAAMPMAQAAPETEAQRDARMEWWREARFGMFVHWGLYSGLAGTWDGKAYGGGVEWLQNKAGVDTATYEKAAKPKFVPTPGFAKQWAKVAKEAGCKYVVFTTKHHEGFALHDSKVSSYDAMDFVNRDLVKEIVDALHAEGLKVGFYHSLIDWHHPQYDFKPAKNLPYPAQAAKAAANETRDHAQYIKHLHTQVDELLSNYGKVDVVWWDYSSTAFDGDKAWGAAELIKQVRAKQPGIIMNNRLYRRPEAGFNGMGTHNVTSRMDPQYGDFVTPEQHIPEAGLGKADWETCMTMNGTWGFSEHDHAWKSPQVLLRNLIDIASKGGNYLLNVGPTGDGAIPKESVERMAEMGTWMKKNSAAIYGTAASPIGKAPFDGRVTKKGNTLYLHVFSRPADGKIVLPVKAAKAAFLDGGANVELKNDGDTTTLTLPEKLSDPIATVVEVRQ
jgi:alpha-L-fucosidase